MSPARGTPPGPHGTAGPGGLAVLQGAPVTVCVLRGERERSRLALLSPAPAVPRCKAGGIWSCCPRLSVATAWLLGGCLGLAAARGGSGQGGGSHRTERAGLWDPDHNGAARLCWAPLGAGLGTEGPVRSRSSVAHPGRAQTSAPTLPCPGRRPWVGFTLRWGDPMQCLLLTISFLFPPQAPFRQPLPSLLPSFCLLLPPRGPAPRATPAGCSWGQSKRPASRGLSPALGTSQDSHTQCGELRGDPQRLHALSHLCPVHCWTRRWQWGRVSQQVRAPHFGVWGGRGGDAHWGAAAGCPSCLGDRDWCCAGARPGPGHALSLSHGEWGFGHPQPVPSLVAPATVRTGEGRSIVPEGQHPASSIAPCPLGGPRAPRVGTPRAPQLGRAALWGWRRRVGGCNTPRVGGPR